MKCIMALEDMPNEPLNEYVYDIFGLIGASGTYSCLRFAEVPAELSWTVSEYDGLETVSVL